jgi:hypothetical protein
MYNFLDSFEMSAACLDGRNYTLMSFIQALDTYEELAAYGMRQTYRTRA